MRLTALLASIVILMSCFTTKNELVVTSPSFTHNGMIPLKYSCQGDNINPPLHIANIPAGTQSLALIIHDPDAPMRGGFTHWVVWNISTSGEIPENFQGADQGINSAKKRGYFGMCPPKGTHHYHFKVYALDTRLHISDNTDKTGLEEAMKGHILSETDLVGLYRKMQ